MYAMLVHTGLALMVIAALSKCVMGLLDGPLLVLCATDDIYFLVGWEVGYSSALALVRHYLLAFSAMVATNNCEQLCLGLALIMVQELF